MTINKFLRDLIIEKKILAKAIADDLAVTPQHISNILLGRSPCPVNFYKTFAKHLSVPVKVLIDVRAAQLKEELIREVRAS